MLFLLLIFVLVTSVANSRTTYKQVYVKAAEKVTFTSPGFPNNYERGLHVVYNIYGEHGYAIQFQVNVFAVAGSDSLVFRERIIPGHGFTVTQNFTGALPDTFQSATHSVQAVFITDSNSTTDAGFSVTAGLVGHKKIELVVPVGEKVSLTSPGFPNKYENNLNVLYSITGPPGHPIQFDTESFELDPFSTTDSLVLSEILPGQTRAAVIGTFTGTKGPSALRSVTSKVTAKFKTDGALRMPGFRITLTTLAPLEETTNLSAPSDISPFARDACFPRSISARCENGNVFYSETGSDDPDYNSTEADHAVLTTDDTRSCRNFIYSAQAWILGQLDKPLDSTHVMPQSVSCNRVNGLHVSENAMDGNGLIFKTTYNLKCRIKFIEFLNKLSSF